MYFIFFREVSDLSELYIWPLLFKYIDNFTYCRYLHIRKYGFIVQEFILSYLGNDFQWLERLYFFLLYRNENSICWESPVDIVPSGNIYLIYEGISLDNDFESIWVESIDTDFFDIILVFSETECDSGLIEKKQVLSIYILYWTICDIDIEAITYWFDDNLWWGYLKVGRKCKYIDTKHDKYRTDISKHTMIIHEELCFLHDLFLEKIGKRLKCSFFLTKNSSPLCLNLKSRVTKEVFLLFFLLDIRLESTVFITFWEVTNPSEKVHIYDRGYW